MPPLLDLPQQKLYTFIFSLKMWAFFDSQFSHMVFCGILFLSLLIILFTIFFIILTFHLSILLGWICNIKHMSIPQARILCIILLSYNLIAQNELSFSIMCGMLEFCQTSSIHLFSRESYLFLIFAWY